MTTPTAPMTVVVVGNEDDLAPGDVIISFVGFISRVIVSARDFIMGKDTVMKTVSGIECVMNQFDEIQHVHRSQSVLSLRRFRSIPHSMP